MIQMWSSTTEFPKLLQTHFCFDQSQHLVFKSPAWPEANQPGTDGSALVWKDVENPLSFLAGGKEVPEPLDSAVLGASAS